MEWIPNVEAVKWLVHEVWPLVRSALPEAKLHLAGKGLQKQDNRFSGPGITVDGEIDNAQHFMQSHGVMLVPVFAAGGIRVKILEAFNLGVPVVSTDIGVQGIHAANEKELLLANTAREFATAMIRMQQEPARRESMVANSRSLIDREYQVDKLISGLLDFYSQILDSTQFKD
jgi:glycosyltransferase involved in cell wall biosynthesis